MAAVSVSANNNRVDDAEVITGVSSRGGGAGAVADPAFPYQGSNSWIRKVTSTTGAGFQYDPVADSKSAEDMTATGNTTWMVKCAVTDSGGLRGNDGVRIIVGDGTNEYVFVVAGTDAKKTAYSQYLLRQLYIIIPIDPNISGYRDGTHSSGTVTLTAVDLFAIDAEFATASAKSENVSLDAIDIGTGLTLVGGDGASADGDWSDFIAADEGTSGNRYGYASALYGTTGIFFGKMTICDGTTATSFAGTGSHIRPDGLYAAGYSCDYFNLTKTGDTITDISTIESLGTAATEDTRADCIFNGTTISVTIAHTRKNYRNYVMTSSVTLDGADIEIVDLAQVSGTIQNSTVRTNAATNVACCNDATFANLSNVDFIQSGAGHAIEITSPGTYTFSSLRFTGYGGTPGTNSTPSSGAADAAIYNNSGGAVTINVSGGDSPSVRNGASATTTVSASVSLTVTVTDSDGTAIEGAAVYLETDPGGVEVLNGDTNASGVVTGSFSGSTPQAVKGWVRSGSDATPWQEFPLGGSITASGYSQSAILSED